MVGGVDETCEFFTCDSLTTRSEVEKLLKEQTALGRQGWRITSSNVPASRMKTRANGEVVALLELVSELACQAPGIDSDDNGGVAGCKTARPHPWKRECFNYVYTFVEVGNEWKRTGRAETTTIPAHDGSLAGLRQSEQLGGNTAETAQLTRFATT